MNGQECSMNTEVYENQLMDLQQQLSERFERVEKQRLERGGAVS